MNVSSLYDNRTSVHAPRRPFRLACLALAFCAAAAADDQSDADQRFADQDWAGAVTLYRKVLKADPDNAQSRFRLGRSLHQLEQHDAARDAYVAALAAGYAREPQLRYHLARVLMSMKRTEDALAELTRLEALGAPNGRILSTTSEFDALKGHATFERVVTTLTPCTAPEYRHFDFWLGAWDVTSAGSPAATASNVISSEQNGCVVLESYTAGGFTGMSINFYDSTTGHWHQSWMSNGGGAVYLEGGLTEDGAMQLSDADLPVSKVTGKINRVTWTPQPDGAVRQHWQQSTDNGETWTTAFDGRYTRQKSGTTP